MAGLPAHERVVALDAEWDTESNSAGMVFKFRNRRTTNFDPLPKIL